MSQTVRNTSSESAASHAQSSVLDDRYQRLCRIVILNASQRYTELEQEITSALESACSYSDVYEALTQSYLFCGFPAALEGLLCLRQVTQAQGLDALAVPDAYNPVEFEQRGTVLCQTIYTSAYDKMRANLALAAPDLDQWMIVEGYGKTLARPALEIQVRELLIVAVLCVGGWKRQLYSHLRGALNVGVSQAACRAVIDLASGDSAARKRYHKILDTILIRSA